MEEISNREAAQHEVKTADLKPCVALLLGGPSA
jgi:hypothetical protein